MEIQSTHIVPADGKLSIVLVVADSADSETAMTRIIIQMEVSDKTYLPDIHVDTLQEAENICRTLRQAIERMRT